MPISCHFDSGNIDVVSEEDPQNIRLQIQKDVGDEHFQWFHFRLSGYRGTPCTLVIENADKVSYPKAWNGYRVAVSYDREHWFRLDTRFASGELSFEITPDTDAVWFAYFAPYSLDRHYDLIGEALCHDDVSGHLLGKTVDGRDLDMLQVGSASEGKKALWIIGRQHPGESMAEWWMEGFLDRLLDETDPLADLILSKAVCYVVPNMNPDGSIRGHLRCNAAGANLNREWHAPTLEKSPEVFHTRAAMDDIGCDFCLDVHGDEELPYNFIAGAEGIPSWTPRLAALQAQFCDALERANPDFQQEKGYTVDAAGQANMTMCTNQIAERFDCLAMTLEQPFKDNANRPDVLEGWSPERCRQLGRSALDGIAAVLNDLR